MLCLLLRKATEFPNGTSRSIYYIYIHGINSFVNGDWPKYQPPASRPTSSTCTQASYPDLSKCQLSMFSLRNISANFWLGGPSSGWNAIHDVKKNRKIFYQIHSIHICREHMSSMLFIVGKVNNSATYAKKDNPVQEVDIDGHLSVKFDV